MFDPEKAKTVWLEIDHDIISDSLLFWESQTTRQRKPLNLIPKTISV